MFPLEVLSLKFRRLVCGDMTVTILDFDDKEVDLTSHPFLLFDADDQSLIVWSTSLMDVGVYKYVVSYQL